MKQGRQKRVKGKKIVPEIGSEREREDSWEPLKEDDTCEDIRADDGSDDYIWPECEDEDEDRL